ncbi:mycothiol transferase [Kibdelosporangium aridum]|uniref:mycothiol transferase n=1 Tax=Kibdelosporangium aridum TaxID=2030 RepID=UPI000527A787
MTSAELLVDAFGRVREEVHAVVDDLSIDDLTFRVNDSANTIAWLVWHLTRVQDDHLAGAADVPQVWTEQGWFDRFGLSLRKADIGYGHSAAQVVKVKASTDLLIGYYDATHEQTIEYVQALKDKDLGRIVDEGWDPPVTLGVRMVSVISDDLQHVGQAAFVRGLLGK